MSTVINPDALNLDNIGRLETANVDAYRQLVGQLANGEELADTVIRLALAASGRSIDTLRQNAQRLRSRLKAIDDMKAADAMTPELEKARANANAARANADRVRREAQAAIKAANEAHSAANMEESRLRNRQQLLRASANQTLLATSAPVDPTIQRLEYDRAKLTDRRTAIQQRIGACREYLEARPRERILRSLGLAKDTDLKRAEQDLADVQAKIAAIDKEIADLKVRRLDPVGGMLWHD